MRRQIEWKRVNGEGQKVTIRVTVAAGKIKWQFQVQNELWAYDVKPQLEHWQELLQKAEDGYRRKRCPYKDLLLIREHVRREERKSGSVSPPIPPTQMD